MKITKHCNCVKHKRDAILKIKMKISFIFMLTTTLAINANSFGQNQKVTLDLEDVTVTQFINAIEEKTEFQFIYDSKIINVKRLISIKAHNEKLERVLFNVFGNTGTSFEISKNKILLLRKKAVSPVDRDENLFQGTELSGKVLDEAGNPIIGASVIVSGTNNGVATDFEGNFKLGIEGNSVTIEVSALGHETKTITITEFSQSITIVLKESAFALNDVLITSRRREESSKDVPIAVTAISGVKLEALQATDISASASIAPNVNFSFGGTTSGSSSAGVVYIRGVGQNDFLQTLDPGVGIYIDGVYLGRTVGSLLGLVNTERVEVLRGPQGTLFGRNSIGGAISVTTKTPGKEFEGFLKSGLGNFNRFNVGVGATVPFSDKFRTSFAIDYLNRDGYVERLIAGDDLGSDNNLGVRSTLYYEPNDKLSFKVNLDYTRESETGAAEEQLGGDGVFANLFNGNILMDPDCLSPECFQNNISRVPFTTNETAPNRNDVDVFGAALIGIYKLSERSTFKSITSYRAIDANFTRGSDGTPIELFQTQNKYEQSQFTQEFQYLFSTDNLDLVGGVFYFNETGTDVANVQAGSLPFIPTFPLLSGGDVDNSSFAAYLESTLHIGERLHLTGGLRYTSDTKRYNPLAFAINADPQNFVSRGFRSNDFSRVTWRGIAAYDISESINGYVSVSTGFKSGGFDARYTSPTTNNDPTSFDAEDLTNYEIGFKTLFKDAGLRLNVAAFLADYKNIQVQGNPPGQIATVTFNGAAAEIKGIETELDWSVVPGLILSGSLGILDAKYTELDADANEFSLDDKLIRTPRLSYSFGASYLIELGKLGSILPRIDLDSQNDIHFEPANNNLAFEDGYVNVNAGVSYKTKDNKFELNASVINLTDERYLLAADSNGTLSYDLGIFARPRNYAVTLKYNF